MTPFRDLPIRRKVALTILATSAMVLLLTSGAFVVYDWRTFRETARADLATLAKIIADNSAFAVQSGNETRADEILEALRAEENIVSAAIYDHRGQRIAHHSSAAPLPPTLPPAPAAGHEFTGTHLVVFQPINYTQQRIGTVVLQSSLAAMHRRSLLYALIVVSILGTATLIAFALSSSIQGRITAPIQELAKTARAITERNDYTIRASSHGHDELGALTDAFNRMLDEIKEREQRLSASEDRLRMALTAAEMGTWRYFPDRRQSIVDENYRRIFGLPPGEEYAGAAEVAARIFPDDRAPMWSAFECALEGPDPNYVFEYRVTSTAGTLRWVRDRGRVVRDASGRVDYVTGTLVDITERKAAEEEIHRLNVDLERRVTERTAALEQANHELEAFTYSVSHDLRGPLRHLSGYAEIIRDDTASQLSAEAKSCLVRIDHAAARLTRLVDSLLNLSHIGRKPLALERTRLDDVVTTALRELESETKNRRVEWQRLALPTVDCDPSLLHIVFVNLLSNALKYTRPRDLAVITIGLHEENRESAIFVRDNGVGFDPRFQHKLFRVFERLHRADEFEGSGIGLATVARIIHKHGGRIWAKSAADEGATFYFTLRGL